MKSEYNIDEIEIIQCPVCGNLVEIYDVCENCNWENTGFINIDFGPNEMSLEEAIDAYKRGKEIF